MGSGKPLLFGWAIDNIITIPGNIYEILETENYEFFLNYINENNINIAHVVKKCLNGEIHILGHFEKFGYIFFNVNKDSKYFTIFINMI